MLLDQSTNKNERLLLSDNAEKTDPIKGGVEAPFTSDVNAIVDSDGCTTQPKGKTITNENIQIPS